MFFNYSIDERRKLLYKMLNFYNNCEIFHDTVVINRKEAMDKLSLSGKLAKGIRDMINSHIEYFNKFDKVIVYYDK